MNGGTHILLVDTPKPRVVQDRDVILKVTGSTICGSDLHLLHGEYSLTPRHRFDN